MSSFLELLTKAQNSPDAERFASYFSDDYHSDQPAHPDSTSRDARVIDEAPDHGRR